MIASNNISKKGGGCLFATLLLPALFLAGCLTAGADDAIWTSNSIGAWSTASNWSPLSAPGSTSSTTSPDTATFSKTSGVTVVIDQSGQNIGSIVFAAGAGADYIVNAPGNSLLLSSGGSITDNITNSTATAETINAPLVLEPASSTTAGTYSFTNNASTGDLLNISGNVIGGPTSSTITLNLNGSNTGNNTISGAISNGNATGGLGITKSGAGTWVLSGPNTYTGTTTINGGTLSTSLLAFGGVDSGIGASTNAATNLLINGGALQYTGAGASTDRLFTINGTTAGATATLDASGSGALNFINAGSLAYGSANQTRTLILTGTNTNNNTLGDVVANNGTGATSLTKSGPGTWVLTNQNTYTGTTTVNGGTLNIGGGAAFGSINSSSALALGGGTLSYTVNNFGTQTFNGTTINSGASAVSTVSGDTIALNAITRNVGGTVDFGTTGRITTSTTTNTSGILGGYATFGGTTWAVAPSFPGNAITGLASYYTTTAGGNTAGNYAPISNVDVTSSPVLSGGVVLNSLRFNTGAPETLTGPAIYVLSGGILVTSNVGNNPSTIGGGGLLGASNADLVVIQNNTSGSLTIYSVIANNGTSGLTKSGAGLLTLGGVNTYTGTTTVNAGTLSLSGSGTLGGTSAPLTINGGTLDLGGTSQNVGALNGAGGTMLDNTNFTTSTLTVGNNNTTGTYAGVIANGAGTVALTKVGTGTQTLSGANTYTGQTTIGAGTLILSGPNAYTGQTLIYGGAALQLGTGGTTGTLSTSSPILDYGTFTINRSNAVVQGTDFTAIPITGNGGLTQAGTGTTTLTSANSYNGGTMVSAGTLVAGVSNSGSAGAFGFSTVGVTLGNAATTTNNSSPTLLINGAFTVTNPITVAFQSTSGVYTIGGSNTAGTATYTGNITLNQGLTVSQVSGGTTSLTGNITSGVPGTQTLTFNNAGLVFQSSGVIGGGFGTIAVTQGGTGTTTLLGANTYSGGTTISSGTLYANNASGSATGTGSVQVNSPGTLAGSGAISGAVTVASGATLYSGAAQGTGYAGSANNNGEVNQTGIGGGLSLSSTLGVNAGSALTFVLGTGNSTGSTVTNPNTNSTYLTASGSAGSVTFGTGSLITINLVDLAATTPSKDTLQLRYQSPYLLITTGSTLSADLSYNLETTGGYDANGFVLGIATSSGAQGSTQSYQPDSSSFSINVLDPSTGGNITNSENYYALQLYLNNGDLEVVPEPGTWAMLVGGLGLLAFWHLRKHKA